MEAMNKNKLREYMLSKRKTLSARSRALQDQKLFQHLKSLPSVHYSKKLLLTLSFREECDTWEFARWAIKKKGFIILPRVHQETRTLKLYRVEDLDQQTQPGFSGIYEPHSQCEQEQVSSIEWVLLPGLAFDQYGGRLGYGGGYFDRLLTLLPKTVYKLALSYRFQLCDQVPMEMHDQRVDAVILPSGVLQTCHLLS